MSFLDCNLTQYQNCNARAALFREIRQACKSSAIKVTNADSAHQLTIKEYERDGQWHIDILSVASGLSSQQEDRTLDWADRAHSDRIFGNVLGRSRLYTSSTFQAATPNADIEDIAFLQAEKLRSKNPSSWEGDEGQQHVQSFVTNTDKGYGWTAEQTWGFEIIEGKRYYTRRVVARSADGAKVERLRLVYSYTGVNEEKKEEDGLAYGE